MPDAWGQGASDVVRGPEQEALRLRRLELDNDDLRAENARLKGSIGERQDEILALGERVARLHAELAVFQRKSVKGSLRRWANRGRRLMRRLG